MIKIMTPGPTQVRENVRLARAEIAANPDLDPAFYDFYRDTCGMLSRFFNTENEFFILSGEGILGLEAACASLTEPHARVLVIDNGIFGRGFADFVSIYGGEPYLYSVDPKKPVNPDALDEFLGKDDDFTYATLVHCDTPSGVLNNVEALCAVLKKHNILTVVDTVSASFGTPLNAGICGIDVLCGASQKALSAPIGLTFLGVSAQALAFMRGRATPIASFYMNILNYCGYYEKKWFPYSMPASDIMGLRAALENVEADSKIFVRHEKIASACRNALQRAGLTLYLESGFSPTITAFNVPDGLTDTAILDAMVRDHGIMLAGCFDVLAGRVIRIGHMGENANVTDMSETMGALHSVLVNLGFNAKCNMKDAFNAAL
ncbi:MAG: alanine--glyoxylate aminotransferase family protein [Clostridia bacterium]